ncbi:phosphoglycerate dehydrogenase [Selenomonas sp. WCA-380-WT-3B 3/]|uniref:D-3-phosphoglycerate dehydrogenase n=1 Tax=Selenomonas montiformis TaxID=2652285 RepID=A0A6I2UV88_9FIRM|nr:phosphoglycerate dehydrogenase [Selenomonas montiformis]MSV24020.1 phosphoglycerate dehydrogenase [Selenomonas montiformis]
MKVLAADGISPKGIELLQKEFDVDVRDKLPAEELLEIIPEYDALMVRSASKVTAEVIARAKNLKIIGRAGVGVDNIDIPAATARGILVINSPGGNTIAATEHTMAMMLAMSRNIPIANETMQKGEWNRKKYVGVELRGKTLGVIGMGRIGSGVAKRAMAFEMNVIAYDPYINEERAKALGVTVGTFEDVITKADFITVHMPLTPDTKGMIGMEQMKRMKKGVRLVNCARGGIIDENDLAEAVRSGIVAGAAIDVYTSEPVTKDHPLVGVPGIVLTPHLGASTVEAQIGVSLDVSRGIIAALHGKPVATAVNMAPVSPQVMKVIAPYLTLAERLGGTVTALADGPVERVEVTYNGEITEVNTGMLTTAVVKGMLNPIMESEVNYVNAPGLAKERGIKVTEVREKEAEDFANLITVTAFFGGKELSVQGTLFGMEGRIVRINKFRVDVDPHARILVCPHINRPGVIGTVGTLLGSQSINISGMQVGKTEEEGTNLMVLTVDDDIPVSVLEQVKAIEGIFDARLVNFYAV